jgi:hypothetical protein
MDETRRRELAATMMEPSPVGDVADAVATFAKRSSAKVYVERCSNGYRWSPAHAGGPYPLLREVALFLDRDHHGLVIGCAAVDGYSIVAPEGPNMPKPRAWAFLTSPADDAVVAEELARLEES